MNDEYTKRWIESNGTKCPVCGSTDIDDGEWPGSYYLTSEKHTYKKRDGKGGFVETPLAGMVFQQMGCNDCGADWGATFIMRALEVEVFAKEPEDEE